MLSVGPVWDSAGPSDATAALGPFEAGTLERGTRIEAQARGQMQRGHDAISGTDFVCGQARALFGAVVRAGEDRSRVEDGAALRVIGGALEGLRGEGGQPGPGVSSQVRHLGQFT